MILGKFESLKLPTTYSLRELFNSGQTGQVGGMRSTETKIFQVFKFIRF